MTQPTLLGRVYAWLQDEVPATVLEAYRRASLPVFEVMDLAEARRLECATEDLNPWTVPPAVRAELLCAWNAFVLQTLGNDILDADYDDSPAAAGYVPPFTVHQVLAFYAQVEEWLTRARQAHANPDFRLDVQVPAELPPWKTSTLEPMPPPLLRGILRAMRSVGEHANAAMAFLPDNAPGPAQQAQLNRIRQLHAAAESKARYALELYGTGSIREVRAKLEPYAREAIELFYELGQLIADPSLAAGAPPPPLPARRRTPGPWPSPKAHAAGGRSTECCGASGRPLGARIRHPAPYRSGGVHAAAARPPGSERAAEDVERLDPDPARTRAIHAEIQSALNRGEIAYASNGSERLGYFHCCPWSAIYVVNRPVNLGGRRLEPMQRFVYNVGALDPADGFKRGILFGNFQETGDLEYGPHRPRDAGG
jgi:hypothetical protein